MKLLSFLALVLAVNAATPEGMRLTPFGLRPAACVLEVESGATIEEVEGGVKVTTKINGLLHERFVASAPECHQDNIVPRYLAMKKHPHHEIGAGEINGWLDNAGWYPPAGENNLLSFTSTYTIPGNPPDPTGQVLFYFIGTQDNAYPNAVNILQPVLTWGNGVPGWNVASWACCPGNITTHSATIANLQAGWHIAGTISRESDSTWLINSQVVETGAKTTLNAQVGDYLYDWADVTLEVYYVSSCTQFATGPMTFNALTIKDSQNQVITPSWTFTGTTSCNGHETSVNATAIQIVHTT
jgi:hypothetical protein